MKFYKNQLFHIYNQGNNRRKIFFSSENYNFFLWKMKAHLLPFGNLVAYCLMPNHFHWLFYVKNVKINRERYRVHVDKTEFDRRLQKYGEYAQPLNRSWKRIADKDKLVDLRESIAILQRSYTRAINKQQKWSGSLFRQKCNAKDGWEEQFGNASIRDELKFSTNNNYGSNCIHYIHKNPIEAGMTAKSTDYYWSSARDYAGLRKDSLCDLEMGKELLRVRTHWIS